MSLSQLSRSIEGSVAIVTGAASGMGRATAMLFAEQGARVAALDVNAEPLQAVVGEIESAGREARGWTADLADANAIDATFTEIADHFGGIDILVNNAGISRPTPIDGDEFEAAWDLSLTVLLTAHTRTIRAALPYLRKADHPRIVNIASTEGLGATKYGSPYTAAKTGVIGLTRSLAVELGTEGITVNCICPGPINTGMTSGIPDDAKAEFARRRVALKRYADPEEVAHATLSLVLPASSFVTGVTLPVDGGLTIRNALSMAEAARLEGGAESGRVGWSTVVSFGAPGLGAGYMYLMMALYVMKFATDVLLIAPAIMGLIFSASRIWDAVSDPVVGYLSDRTRIRYGRRRTWILASTLPIGAAFIMVFAPPAGLTGAGLVIWMAVAIIGFYSAMTVFFVPHLSLGAELSSSYHERSRLFGVRHGFYTFGSILSLISFYLLISAEQQGRDVVRETALDLAFLASGMMVILILLSVGQLKERSDYQGRVNENPFHAFRDVWRNHHARLLIVVTFIEHVGSAAIGALTLYVAQYVIGATALGAGDDSLLHGAVFTLRTAVDSTFAAFRQGSIVDVLNDSYRGVVRRHVCIAVFRRGDAQDHLYLCLRGVCRSCRRLWRHAITVNSG